MGAEARLPEHGDRRSLVNCVAVVGSVSADTRWHCATWGEATLYCDLVEFLHHHIDTPDTSRCQSVSLEKQTNKTRSVILKYSTTHTDTRQRRRFVRSTYRPVLGKGV